MKNYHFEVTCKNEKGELEVHAGLVTGASALSYIISVVRGFELEKDGEITADQGKRIYEILCEPNS